MSQIVKYTCKELGKVEISCLMIGNEPLFKAKDITQILKHTNTTDKTKTLNQCMVLHPNQRLGRTLASQT